MAALNEATEGNNERLQQQNELLRALVVELRGVSGALGQLAQVAINLSASSGETPAALRDLVALWKARSAQGAGK
jgi:hypothetical protein